MLSPNTAQPGRSVWTQIDRETFENDLDSLHNTNFVLGPHTLQEEDWPRPRTSEILPFAIEKQLADDIAFVSAYDYGVRFVTAAAIEASECDGLIVRLAANEGVCATVVDALTRLFSTLERCAKKAISREQCREDAFNIHENGPDRPALSERLKAYTKILKRQSAKTEELHRQVAAFHVAFLDVENSEAETGKIRRVVMEAFQLTVNGVSLSVRLESAGFPPSAMDSREIREINKIANYWRVCHSLAHLSRSYRTLFSKITLKEIEPFAPSVRLGSHKRRYVHAEIQLLAYYERRGPWNWPRVLGASKEACFLCNSFINAHGFFFVSKAHRQIYSQWTIPDLADYSAESLNRLQRTLTTVYQDVASALKQARCDRKFRAFPLQSSINLLHPRYPTPSVTTIHSLPSEATDIPSGTVSPSSPHLSPVSLESVMSRISQLSLNQHSPLSAVSMSIPPKGSSDNTSGEEAPDCTEDHRGRVDLNLPSPICPGWLDLYVSLECSSTDSPATKTFSTASVNQKYLPSSIVGQTDHLLDLNTLAVGEEIVLPNLTDPDEYISAGAEMSVILTYFQMDPPRALPSRPTKRIQEDRWFEERTELTFARVKARSFGRCRSRWHVPPILRANITKCDALQPGDEQGVLRIAKNEVEKLTHGWFVVKNRSTQEIIAGVTIKERHKRENHLFLNKSPMDSFA
ncbi:hypothetical protein PMIN02_010994 [Paraphaeosphaeria minitans]